MDQEMKTTRNILIALLCIFLLVMGFAYISIYRYLQGTKLKIVEDISPSEAILIQKDFGIDLPPEAEIISFGYSKEDIVFRIEGVVDLEAFLTESLSLEIDTEEAKRLSDLIHQGIEGRIPEDANMDETAYFLWGFHYHEYQDDSHDFTYVCFLLEDGKLIIKISARYFVTDNRQEYREIVNR